jgi:sporulation integral membrane protein YlbJ
MNYFFIVILIFLIVFFFNHKSSKIIYLKKLILPISCTILILCLIIFSKSSVTAAAKGLKLWLEIVFPSLFPFFVVSNVLTKTGFVKSVGILLEPIMRPLFNVPGCASFALALGISSGYPVGAKITAGLRKEQLISKTEAERLLTFTNNSGPLFIVGAVAVGMFQNSRIGIFLLICHISACITVGLMFRFYRRKETFNAAQNNNLFLRFKSEVKKGKVFSFRRFGGQLGEAIQDSLTTILAIGGFIIFFSVIINILLESGLINYLSDFIFAALSTFGIHKNIITSILSGFFEITTGTGMASKCEDVSIITKLTTASLIIGWAGLSVHLQVLSIISKTDISIKPYLIGKTLQGVFSACYTFLGFKIAGSLFKETKPAFLQSISASRINWYYYMISSCKYLIISIIILLLLFAINFIYKTVRNF